MTDRAAREREAHHAVWSTALAVFVAATAAVVIHETPAPTEVVAPAAPAPGLHAAPAPRRVVVVRRSRVS